MKKTRDSLRRKRQKEEFVFFLFEVADVVWQWAFWLTFAVMSRVMWILLEPSENEGNIPALLLLLLTYVVITITVKLIHSRRKRKNYDLHWIHVDRCYSFGNSRNRFRIAGNLAFQRSMKRKSRIKKQRQE